MDHRCGLIASSQIIISTAAGEKPAVCVEIACYELSIAAPSRPTAKLKTALPAAMEARSVDAIPRGSNGSTSRNGTASAACSSATATRSTCDRSPAKPLTRYFPELVEPRCRLKPTHFVLDGEIVVPEGEFSFDDLLQRIHPAASRIRKLSRKRLRCYRLRSAGRRQNERLTRAARKRRPGARRFRQEVFRSNIRHPAVAGTPKLADRQKWLAHVGGRLRRHHRQAPRPALPVRQSRRHAEDQELPLRRLRGRRLSLATTAQCRWSARCCSVSTTTRAAASRRLHLGDQATRSQPSPRNLRR